MHLVFLANLGLKLTSFVNVYCEFSWKIKIYIPHKYKWSNLNIFHIRMYNFFLLLICLSLICLLRVQAFMYTTVVEFQKNL